MIELSILIPCLNEEEAAQHCIDEIKEVLSSAAMRDVASEVIFIDNGSSDGTRRIIEENIASFPALKLATEPRKGYGSAYRRGFAEASGTRIFMADCDGTYDFRDIPRFLEKLRVGADLVLGNRFDEKLEFGVMPWHREHIGNPGLSFLVRKLFGVKVIDIHCGARAISRATLNRISPRSSGMELASEMVIQCAKQGTRIEEIPISYKKRIGTSKLRSFRDGLRHLKVIFEHVTTR